MSKIACDHCGSSDARHVYADHSYCFACPEATAWQPLEGTPTPHQPKGGKAIQADLSSRGLSSDTTATYKVMQKSNDIVFTYKGCNKYRTPDKRFTWDKYSKQAGLFGQEHFSAGGKCVIVTEGEYDAMAAFQMLAGRVVAVSVENGAGGAIDSLKRQYEWLDSFEKIVIAFDNDAPGRNAAEECAELFSHKAYIVRHASFKDANEYLMQSSTAKWVAEFNNAERYTPSGIVSYKNARALLEKEEQQGLPWCFDGLTKLTYGRRWGEIYAFGAGVAMGKTDVFTQSIAYDLTKMKEPVGVFYLEQPIKETIQRILGKIDGKLYHLGYDKDAFLKVFDNHTLDLQLFNHVGGKSWEEIKSKMLYLNKAMGYKVFYLDHLTALVSDVSDERRSLDKIMCDMASFAQQTGSIIHFISHLTTPGNGASHEEGAKVRERDFTGSRAIARWSHYMFGLEGNKAADDPEERNRRVLRVVKDRYTGQATNECVGLFYNAEDGMLYEQPVREVSSEIL